MGQLSPDGMWRWDGMRWVPVSSSQPLASGPARSRPWIAIGGGATSIGAVILQFSACIFPYAYYSDGSPSIFNGAFVGDAWFIAEPELSTARPDRSAAVPRRPRSYRD